MTHVTSASSQAFSQTRQPSEQDAARPDFQFWHEVFDQAYGSVADGSAHGQGGPDGVLNDAEALARTVGPAPFDDVLACHAQQVQAASGQVTEGEANAFTPWRAPGVSALLRPVAVGAPAFAALSFASDAGGDNCVATTTAGEPNQAKSAHASPEKSEFEPAVRAHVVLSAEGELKVALRAQRGLSASQALEAVAQAVNQAGESSDQVEQVVLNGKQIYQRVSERQAGAKASSTFELKC